MGKRESYFSSSRRRIPSFILLSCRCRRRRGTQCPPLPLPFAGRYLRARVLGRGLCGCGSRRRGTDDAARGGEVVGFVAGAGAEVAHFWGDGGGWMEGMGLVGERGWLVGLREVDEMEVM